MALKSVAKVKVAEPISVQTTHPGAYSASSSAHVRCGYAYITTAGKLDRKFISNKLITVSRLFCTVITDTLWHMRCLIKPSCSDVIVEFIPLNVFYPVMTLRSKLNCSHELRSVHYCNVEKEDKFPCKHNILPNVVSSDCGWRRRPPDMKVIANILNNQSRTADKG